MLRGACYHAGVHSSADDSRLRALIRTPLRVQGGRLTHSHTRAVIARGRHEVLRDVARKLAALHRDRVVTWTDEQLARRVSLARDTGAGRLAAAYLAAELASRRQLAAAESHPLARSTERITFAPVYMPNVPDSWNTFAEPDTLTNAVDRLNRSSDRDISVDHSDVVVGERLQMFTWPFEHQARLLRVDGSSYDRTLPAHTAYMRARWHPEAWPSVLAGHIRGFSIEGSAAVVPSDGPAPTVGVAG